MPPPGLNSPAPARDPVFWPSWALLLAFKPFFFNKLHVTESAPAGAIMKMSPQAVFFWYTVMRTTRKFWPLDYDPEGEIYENLAWDLPGFRPAKRSHAPSKKPARKPAARR